MASCNCGVPAAAVAKNCTDWCAEDFKGYQWQTPEKAVWDAMKAVKVCDGCDYAAAADWSKCKSGGCAAEKEAVVSTCKTYCYKAAGGGILPDQQGYGGYGCGSSCAVAFACSWSTKFATHCGNYGGGGCVANCGQFD